MSYNDKYPDMSAMYAVQFEYENKLKDKIKELETELERTHEAFETAVDGLLAVWRATEHTTKQGSIAYNVLCDLNIKPLDRIKALEQKN